MEKLSVVMSGNWVGSWTAPTLKAGILIVHSYISCARSCHSGGMGRFESGSLQEGKQRHFVGCHRPQRYQLLYQGELICQLETTAKYAAAEAVRSPFTTL